MIDRQGDLGVLRQVAEPGIHDREFLVRQVDETPLVAPPDNPRLPADSTIVFSCQGNDLFLQDLGHGLETQRDEGLNQGPVALDLVGPRHGGHGPTPDLFDIALFANPEYSFQWSRFVSFQLRMAHLRSHI